MTAQLDIQQALKAVFVADTGAGGLRNASSPLVTGVHDFVPPNTTPPYIVLGDATEVPKHTFGKRAFEVMHAVQVWSDGTSGFEQVLAAIARMNTLIDAVPGTGESAALTAALATEGWVMVSCSYRGTTDGFRGPDGEVRNKIATYRVFVESTT